MNNRAAAIAFVVVALFAGAAGYFLGRGNKGRGEETAEKPENPLVPVKVMPLARKAIAETISAYGTVAALPEKVVVYSSQFDGVVEKLYVATGQSVKKGDALVDIAPAPEVVLTLRQAVESTAAAERDLKLVQQRYDNRLATAQELSQAQSTLAAAKLKQQDLEQRGAGKPRATIAAAQAGVVSKIDLTQGQAATSGAGIVEILPAGQSMVRAGVEAAQAERVRAGQKAKIKSLSSVQEAIEGTVKMVGQKVNPDTRLVEILIELPAGAEVVLDTPVSVAIEIASKEGFVIPRDAALPAEEGKFELFTVKDNKAVKHEVALGIQAGDEVEVTGEDLKEGDPVVVSGNYQLEDKMEVKVGGDSESTTQPTSEPASQPATSRDREGEVLSPPRLIDKHPSRRAVLREESIGNCTSMITDGFLASTLGMTETAAFLRPCLAIARIGNDTIGEAK